MFSNSMRLLWCAVGFSLGVILGAEVSGVVPVQAIGFSLLVVSTVALGFGEVREVLGSSAPQAPPALEVPIGGAKTAHVQVPDVLLGGAMTAHVHFLDVLLAEDEDEPVPLRRAKADKAEVKCLHRNLTRKGTNHFMEHEKCKDCKKLLYYKVLR